MTLNEPWCSAYHRPRQRPPRAGPRPTRATASQAMHHLLLGARPGALPALRANDRRAAWASSPTSAAARRPATPPPTARPPSAVELPAQRLGARPAVHGPLSARRCASCGRAPSRRCSTATWQIIGAPLDFLGINYYFRTNCRQRRRARLRRRAAAEGVERTQMGWEVYPDGLRDLLIGFKQRYPNLPPIYITENGMACDDAVDGRPRATTRSASRSSTATSRRSTQAMQRGRRRARLLRLVADGQLRMGLRLRAALRHRACGLRHAGAHAQGQRELRSAQFLEGAQRREPESHRMRRFDMSRDTTSAQARRHDMTDKTTRLAPRAARSRSARRRRARAGQLKAEVIHWWTSGGESAAVKELADAYTQGRRHLGRHRHRRRRPGARRRRSTASSAAIRPPPRSSTPPSSSST